MCVNTCMGSTYRLWILYIFQSSLDPNMVSVHIQESASKENVLTLIYMCRKSSLRFAVDIWILYLNILYHNRQFRLKYDVDSWRILDTANRSLNFSIQQ